MFVEYSYRNFPVVWEEVVDLESPRKYLCNFVGTVYPNSSREILIDVIRSSQFKERCYINERLEYGLFLCNFTLLFSCLYIFLYFISSGPQPVGVQCSLTSSLGEFPGYWDWLWYPGLQPVLVSVTFFHLPSSFHCFPFTPFHLGNWTSFVFLLYDRYISTHLVDPSITQFFIRLFSILGT